MCLPLPIHEDAEPLVTFLWCLAVYRAEQERQRKMHWACSRD